MKEIINDIILNLKKELKTIEKYFESWKISVPNFYANLIPSLEKFTFTPEFKILREKKTIMFLFYYEKDYDIVSSHNILKFILDDNSFKLTLNLHLSNAKKDKHNQDQFLDNFNSFNLINNEINQLIPTITFNNLNDTLILFFDFECRIERLKSTIEAEQKKAINDFFKTETRNLDSFFEKKSKKNAIEFLENIKSKKYKRQDFTAYKFIEGNVRFYFNSIEIFQDKRDTYYLNSDRISKKKLISYLENRISINNKEIENIKELPDFINESLKVINNKREWYSKINDISNQLKLIYNSKHF
jgi:hypothetical protein